MRNDSKWQTMTNADSIIDVVAAMPKGEYESMAFAKQNELLLLDKETESQKLMSYLVNRVESENNDYGRGIYAANLGFASLRRKDLDSVLLFANMAEKLIPIDSSHCDVFQLLYLLHQAKGDVIQSKQCMANGLLSSEKEGDIPHIRFFANALGEYYSNRLLAGIALKYFVKAYDTYTNDEPPPSTLLATIISIKIKEGDFLGAQAFWKVNEELLHNAKDTYTRQRLFINKIALNINLQRWDESAALFSSLPDSVVVADFRLEYLTNKLLQLKQVEPSDLPKAIHHFTPWLSHNYSKITNPLKMVIVDAIKLNPSSLSADSLNSWKELNKEQFANNDFANANHYELISVVYNHNDDPKKAYECLSKSRNYLAKYELVKDSIRSADALARKEFDEILSNHLADESTLMNKTERDSNRFYITIFLLCLFLFLGFFIWYRLPSIPVVPKKYTVAQQDHAPKKQNLLDESEVNERVLQLSGVLKEKSLELSKKLGKINKRGAPDIEAIRKELEILGSMGLSSLPQFSDIRMKEKFDVFQVFPQMKTMNNTEKKIFLLSIDGHKSKEIATELGVSIQYIHNVRSKIRRVLGIDNTIKWDSFKDDHS
ncbi:MAG: sigma-70 region 4 domain-containing protein [Bacteroidetes bacterium]|nr:sigma-70 region 4 domain-containing protein [Bacteroidota bacterium]